MTRLFLCFALLSGCGDDRPDTAVDACATCRDDASPSGDDAGTDAGPTGTCTATADPEVVTFDTDDGVTLEAAFFAQGTVGGRGLVLLHMIPPFNTRANYSRPVIDGLVAQGFSVLNVDRRGAGGSGGVAEDAYTGPNGRLDAKAAVDFLAAHDCVDPTRIGLVGASNGTTTVLDYTIGAAGDDAQASPQAIVFLTGGGYTEAQNSITANRAVLDPLPLLFVFSTMERAWSAQFTAGASPSWQFEEYPMGDHGTSMFTADPSSIDDVGAFLDANVP